MSYVIIHIVKPTDCGVRSYPTSLHNFILCNIYFLFYLTGPLTVHIMGPHSAPASTIFSSQHVAMGIGVTPAASILQSWPGADMGPSYF